MSQELSRIIIHWTAGGYRASVLDKNHYHFLYQGDGNVVPGDLPPDENITLNDRIYGAHTRNLNTGSIGVAFCGMASAVITPFSTGPYPLLNSQLRAGYAHIGALARRYGIPIERTTVLTHAEVEPTLRVKQRGKWDIRWLPGMEAIGPAVEVGDQIRAAIRAAQ